MKTVQMRYELAEYNRIMERISVNTQTAQHTPGPWQISEGDYGIYRIFSATADKLPFPIAKDVARGVDARLIAAAPDMAEALKAIKRLIGGPKIGSPEYSVLLLINFALSRAGL